MLFNRGAAFLLAELDQSSLVAGSRCRGVGKLKAERSSRCRGHAVIGDLGEADAGRVAANPTERAWSERGRVGYNCASSFRQVNASQHGGSERLQQVVGRGSMALKSGFAGGLSGGAGVAVGVGGTGI